MRGRGATDHMELALDKLFSDNMVLPSGRTFHVSGRGVPGRMIRVRVASQVVTTSVTASGTWSVEVDPGGDAHPKEGSLVVDDKQSGAKVVVEHVRFGHVYLLGGQSNIEFRMREDEGYVQALDAMPQPWAYVYTVPQVEYLADDGSVMPEGLDGGAWLPLGSASLGNVSAVGYYALQAIHREHPDEVVGLVDCFKGGTSASCWVPPEVLVDPSLHEAYVEPFEAAIADKDEADFDREQETYESLVERHNDDLARYRAAHPDRTLSEAKNVVGHTPWPPPARPTSPYRPSGLYGTMFVPASSYSYSAIVWYQGEDDSKHAKLYHQLLTGLIGAWRHALHDAEVPIYVMQLPGYADDLPDSWALVRQAQLRVSYEMPGVHLVSIADTGDEHNIHPASKRVAGERLGRVLSSHSCDGTPVPGKVHLRDDALTVEVDDAESIASDGDAVAEVREDTGWNRVCMTVQNDPPRVLIPVGANTTRVRYGYENYPHLVIRDDFGQPLAPFELALKEGEWSLA